MKFIKLPSLILPLSNKPPSRALETKKHPQGRNREITVVGLGKVGFSQLSATFGMLSSKKRHNAKLYLPPYMPTSQ